MNISHALRISEGLGAAAAAIVLSLHSSVSKKLTMVLILLALTISRTRVSMVQVGQALVRLVSLLVAAKPVSAVETTSRRAVSQQLTVLVASALSMSLKSQCRMLRELQRNCYLS